MTNILDSQLGKKSQYQTEYNPKLLFPIARKDKRAEIGIDDGNLGFDGWDLWNHYEISWLNKKGKPEVACGELVYSCKSPNIIESKSMKLYFNSFNNTKIDSIEELESIVIRDLSLAIGCQVLFKIIQLSDVKNTLNNSFAPIAINLDVLDVDCEYYQPHPEYLITNEIYVKEMLCSNLLKSNCLVTNQPDWGSICIDYVGNQIDHIGLLKYIVSLRDHNEFHEQCVERIFTEIVTRCNPSELSVYARYTRRGGLDINPFRSTLVVDCSKYDNMRMVRQ